MLKYQTLVEQGGHKVYVSRSLTHYKKKKPFTKIAMLDPIGEDREEEEEKKKKKKDAASVIGVKGCISVGKSTLLRDAQSNHAIPVFIEYAPDAMIADYLSGDLSAYTIQISMMHAACTREYDGLRVAETLDRVPISAVDQSPNGLLRRDFYTDRVVILERPPLENRVFALANAAAGKMCRQDYWRYRKYVDEMIAEAHSSGIPQYSLFLWATQERVYADMLARNNKGESHYDKDNYLACLHHVYFLDFLGGYLEGYEDSVAVLDWRAYGTYRDAKKLASASLSLRFSIERDASAFDDDNALLVPVSVFGQEELIVDTLGDEFAGDVVVSDCIAVCRDTYHLHVNMDGYMRATKPMRTLVQDIFFSQIALHRTSDEIARCCSHVHIHGWPSDAGSIHSPDHPFVTGDDYVSQ